MIEWSDDGIVLSARLHGETGAIVSILTRDHGRVSAYVHGATSARRRALLDPANMVFVHWQAKAEGQLGHFELELEKSVVQIVFDDAMKLTAVQAACALVDRALPERERHQGIFEGFKALLTTFDSNLWPAAYIGWELGLLRDLGFGLDLSECAATGVTEDLMYVSPRSGRAVSAAAGAPYQDKLLTLPQFLQGKTFARGDAMCGLRLTGYFLLHRVFAETHMPLPEPRLRLEEKIFNVDGDIPAE